jgi:hypothetical protein
VNAENGIEVFEFVQSRRFRKEDRVMSVGDDGKAASKFASVELVKLSCTRS